MSAGQWGSTRATKWETHVFRAALERIVACAPAISRVSFSFSDGDERLSQSAPRRRWRQARRRAPSMAASLDPATQAGIGAFAGLVEVTAQQVRRAACLQRKSSSLRLGTNPEPALSLSARRAFSRHRSRCARRRARVHDERDVPRYASRRATSSRVRVGPWGRPLTVPSPPKKNANEKRKHSPCTR